MKSAPHWAAPHLNNFHLLSLHRLEMAGWRAKNLTGLFCYHSVRLAGPDLARLRRLTDMAASHNQ
jgi:hypothetical protein